MYTNRQEGIYEHHSVRVILLNQNNELLLMKAEDATTTEVDGSYHGPFWFLIGGQVEEGESIEETALREIQEETGIEAKNVNLGPVVWYGDFYLILSGVKRHMWQKFIVAHTAATTLSLEGLTHSEKKVVKSLEWFSLERIKTSQEIIYPVGLEEELEPLLAGRYPQTPLQIKLDKKPRHRR